MQEDTQLRHTICNTWFHTLLSVREYLLLHYHILERGMGVRESLEDRGKHNSVRGTMLDVHRHMFCTFINFGSGIAHECQHSRCVYGNRRGHICVW